MPTPALGPRFTACKIAEVSRISQPMRFARINCTQQTGARRPPQQADPLQPGQSARKRAPYRTFSRAWAFCPRLLARHSSRVAGAMVRPRRRDRWCLRPVHEGIVSADMEPTSLGDLALGYQPKLGVREGVKGHPTYPEQPRAQPAFDLEAQRALGARHPTFALDPQLPIEATQVPGPMFDPRCRTDRRC